MQHGAAHSVAAARPCMLGHYNEGWLDAHLLPVLPPQAELQGLRRLKGQWVPAAQRR